MRIIVNDIAASNGGALSILQSFYNYIYQNCNEHEWIFLLSDYYIEEKANIKIKIINNKNKFRKIWFDFISGRKIINKLNPDYVLSLQNIITFGVNSRQGVYVHQAIPFQKEKKFSFFKKNERIYAIYQYLIGFIIKLSIKKANDVYVQTKWMKNSIVNSIKKAEGKIYIIKYSAGEVQENISWHWKNNNFFYPALSENIYKNQKCIYEACDILKKDGINNFSVTLTLERENIDNIIFVGKLKKNELYEQYKSSILIFPSFIESLGLPLIESKNLNSIILVADCQYAHEVLENYNNVYYFDPYNSNELAILMKKMILGDYELKKYNYKNIECPKEEWETLVNIINRQ